MEVKLLFFKSDGQAKSVPIVSQTSVVGRRDDCDIRVPLLGVSRRHCELVRNGQAIRVKDLASSNGTFVNDQRVTETILSPGDRLTVGPITFTVQIDGKPDQIVPKAAAPKPQAPSKPKVVASAQQTGGGIDPDSDEFADMLMGDDDDGDPLSALETMPSDIDLDLDDEDI